MAAGPTGRRVVNSPFEEDEHDAYIVEIAAYRSTCRDPLADLGSGIRAELRPDQPRLGSHDRRCRHRRSAAEERLGHNARRDIIAGLPQVTVPPPANAAAAEPTGIIFNGSTDFDLTAGNPATSAIFIFATKQGTIAGWNPGVSPVTAVTKVDESAKDAVFTGLTWIVVDGEHELLAANIHSGAVEAFDKSFNRLLDFTISAVPGFAPYNVQAVGPNVVVTFGEQNATKNATVNEPGLGFVVVFDTHGNIVSELENGAWFDAPWGVALAPQDFGTFSHDLLIANRGSGTISAFNPVSGRFIGTLEDANNDPITISGLWGIEVGAGSAASGPSTTLFFAAGLNGYADGLFGTLTPSAAELDVEDHL